MLSPGVLLSRASSRWGLTWQAGSRAFASTESRLTPLSYPDNFRDVAKGIPGIKKGVLFRSSGLEADANNTRLFEGRHKIQHVIDLTYKTEEEQSKRNASSVDSQPLPTAAVHYIDLHGPAYTKHILRQLSLPASLSFVMNMILRRPKVTSRLINEHVVKRNGLTRMAVDELDHSGEEIKDVFTLLAKGDAYPALIECSNGKDRTGLIVFLLLKILGAPEHYIVADYCESEKGLARRRDQLLSELDEMGLTPDFADAPQAWVSDLTQYLEITHGGVDKYLDGIGVDNGMRTRIRENLLRNPQQQLQ